MGSILGSVPVSGFISPSDDTDVYPAHTEEWGRGGYRTVADLTDRDAITTERRLEGMLVNVIATGTVYQLVGGIANTDWAEFSSGGGNTGTSGPKVFNPYEFSTLASQAVYDAGVQIDDKAIEVIYNGNVLPPSDYVIGVSDVTVAGLVDNGELVIKVYESVDIANTYTQAEMQQYLENKINDIQER